MAQTEGEKLTAHFQVERVIDPNSEDLHDALKLYSHRIPPSEQFELPDIIRWIREDLEQIERGILRPRDFFLVAKLDGQVCGFVLFHYYPTAQLAFIAYLVAAKDQNSPNYSREGVSRRLLAEVRNFVDGPIKDCQGILLEVDRPSTASTEQEMSARLARIRLFCMLAQAQGFSLRACDIDYLQPPLSLERPDENVPMLLMYVNPRESHAASYMKSSAVRKILKFVYTELYPEGYSDNDSESRRYKTCLRKFCAARLKTLPKRIPMLDFKQIKARTGEISKITPESSASPPLAESAKIEKEVGDPRLSKRFAKFRTASRIGTFYILDWALLGVVIASLLALGGLAMSETKYTLADILYVLGIGLFIAKASYDHRNHELKPQLLVIFLSIGCAVLSGLLIWVESDRRSHNQKITSANDASPSPSTEFRPGLIVPSPSPIVSPVVKQAQSPTPVSPSFGHARQATSP